MCVRSHPYCVLKGHSHEKLPPLFLVRFDRAYNIMHICHLLHQKNISANWWNWPTKISSFSIFRELCWRHEIRWLWWRHQSCCSWFDAKLKLTHFDIKSHEDVKIINSFKTNNLSKLNKTPGVEATVCKCENETSGVWNRSKYDVTRVAVELQCLNAICLCH